MIQEKPQPTLVVVAVNLVDTGSVVLWVTTNVDTLLLVYLQHSVSIQRHRGIVQVTVTFINCQYSDRTVPVPRMGLKVVGKRTDSWKVENSLEES